MMTGEYLLSKSSLPSGTAREHFLALQGGASRIVYASQFSVGIEDSRLTLTQRPKREAKHELPEIRAAYSTAPEGPVGVVTAPSRLYLCTDDDAVTIHQAPASSLRIQTADHAHFTVLRGDALNMRT